MKNRLFLLCVFILIFSTTACSHQERKTLTVLTHDSFAISEAIIREFENSYQVKIAFIKNGDAGAVLNQAILTKNAPLGDVLFGIDNTLLSRAVQEDLFIPYQSPMSSEILPALIPDSQYLVTPVDYGDVCINYDIAYFQTHNLPLPQALEDLSKPEYSNLLVVENPATSSPGLAFLMATIAHFGDPGYLEYWKQLKANGVDIVDGWETAYYTNFSGSAGKGAQPMVVSYASSPAAEVVFADPPRNDAPTASILAEGMCFRQIEYAGIIKGSENVLLAQKFIDFMLGLPFQEDIPLQMFMYPANRNAKLPPEFAQFAPGPDQPTQMDPQAISTQRDAWIKAWTDVMLR